MKQLLVVFSMFLVTLNSRAQQPKCDPDLWQHVYNPSRLQGTKDCKTVTGVVTDVIKDGKDGDVEILLKLDAQYAHMSLTNSVNDSKQGGSLVVEIICAGKPTEADAVKSCANYANKITIPKKSDHISVTGTFVTDSADKHGWNELHPVSELTVLKN